MSVAILPRKKKLQGQSSRGQLLRDLLLTMNSSDRAYLSGVTWQDYVDLMIVRDTHRSGIRIQFDDGELELMASSFPHDSWKHMLSLFVAAMAEELDVPIVGGGSMTVSRKDYKKGFEPDGCFYIRNYRKAIPQRELDFTKDPPPDLAIEIEYSRTTLPRLPIYEAFEVPEIWRFDGEAIKVLIWNSRKKYVAAARSPSFPTVPLEKLGEFLQLMESVDQTTILKQFRAWLRDTIRTHSTKPRE